jgi:hypothetical protein
MGTPDFSWLPAGLSTNAARKPTGWWVLKRPQASDFALAEGDLDPSRYAAATNRLGGLGWGTVALAALIVAATVALKAFSVVDQRLVEFLLLAEAAFAIALYWRWSTPYARQVNSYRAAGSRRDAFRQAASQFETQIQPWRLSQTDPQYWAALKPGGDFAQAVADLLLGLYLDGAAALTAPEGEGGEVEADIVASSGDTKIIVRCGRAGAAVTMDDLRRLAGAKLFFRADVAILAAPSFEGMADVGTARVQAYVERCGLTLWDAGQLAQIAAALNEGQAGGLSEPAWGGG